MGTTAKNDHRAFLIRCLISAGQNLRAWLRVVKPHAEADFMSVSNMRGGDQGTQSKYLLLAVQDNRIRPQRRFSRRKDRVFKHVMPASRVVLWLSCQRVPALNSKDATVGFVRQMLVAAAAGHHLIHHHHCHTQLLHNLMLSPLFRSCYTYTSPTMGFEGKSPNLLS